MKLLRIALPIAFFVFSSPTIIYTQKSPQAVSLPAQDAAFVDKIFEATMWSVQQMDHIVEQLALLISKHQLTGFSNPDHICRTLVDHRQLLQSFLQVGSSIEDPAQKVQLAVNLLQFCDMFIPHLEKALKDLDAIAPFTIEQFLKRRTQVEDLDLKVLYSMTEDVFNRVEKLKISADKVGLTWYNLTARSFDNKVVKPWNKWHGTQVVKGVGGAALLSGYVIWRYGAAIDNSIIQAMHKKLSALGTPLHLTTQGQVVPHAIAENASSSDNNKSFISLADLVWNEVSSGHAPLAMLAGGALWKFYSDTWQQSISPWLDHKRASAWNYVRGGSYTHAETSQMLTAIDPKVNFDHMVGLEEVKEEFKAILEYLDNPEKFNRAELQPETGWILTGPTRTGKSFSFECLCGEIVRMYKRKGMNPNFKFIKIGVEEIAKVGIQTILAFARDNAPMILFIDEIDLLGLSRVGDNKLLHDFLTALQSTQTEDPSKVVMVMAATNSPETLDKALRQYGRLGKEIRFEYPGFKHRKQFLTKEIKGMALNPDNFDINAIIGKMNGKSYEDIKAILRRAMTRSWALNMPLTQKLIEDSINTEMYKIIMHDRKELPESELQILASHFAGKSLVMSLLDTHAQLDIITIKAIMVELIDTSAWHSMFDQKDKKNAQQKIVHGGMFTKHTHDTIDLKTAQHVINEARVLIAGFVAEEIITGSCGMQCHPEDNDKAYDIIEQLVFKGINPNRLSKKAREQLRDDAYALLKQCKEEVKKLLEDNREALEALTQELLKKQILSDSEVKAVISSIKK